MDQGKNSAEGTLDKMFVVVYFGIQSSKYAQETYIDGR